MLSPFCETFFTDVKVPKGNLVGEEGQGWTIGKRLLQHERTNLSGGGSRLQMSGPSLADLAKKYVGTDDGGAIADKDLRARIAKWDMDWRTFQLTALRVMAESKDAGGVSEVSSILKTVGTKLGQERAELMIEIEGFERPGLGRRRVHAGRAASGPDLALRQGDDDLWRIDRGPEQCDREADPGDAGPSVAAAVTRPWARVHRAANARLEARSLRAPHGGCRNKSGMTR